METLLPIEQKAVKVSAACSGVFLTVLVGTIITVNVLGATKNPSSSIPNDTSGSYVTSFPINPEEFENTILSKTKDAGEEYIKDTLFVGDSNTDALYKYGLVPLDQVSAKVGVGVGAALTDKVCYFENDSKGYTMVETIAKMKPRRVIFNFGTNNAPHHTTDEFIKQYKEVLNAVKEAYPYTDIIVNAVYPIAKTNNYPDISIETIDSYNQALATMCKEDGYKFLNTTEILKGEDGYLKSEYANPDGIHLKVDALKSVLVYIREHAYTESKDTRPDTNNIPKRRKVEEEQQSTTSQEITASYHVEVSDGRTYGVLKGDGFSNETSKQFKVTAEQNEFTVTAVPNEGYEFVRWSDGVETATRTDKNLTKNLSVTAVFRSKASISITASKTEVKSSGEDITFTASASGGANNKISWQLNGKTLSGVSGETVSFNVKPGDKITASIGSATSSTITMKLKATLSISASANKCNVGQTVTFTASGDGVDLDNIVWKVDGSKQQTGRSFSFKPNTAQTYTISATSGDVVASVQLNVVNPAPPPPPVVPDSPAAPSSSEKNPDSSTTPPSSEEPSSPSPEVPDPPVTPDSPPSEETTPSTPDQTPMPTAAPVT